MCAQILVCQQFHGIHFWIQKSFALPRVWLRRFSWWNCGSVPVWTHFTKKMKMLSRPDSFMLYGKLGAEIFCSSELLYLNMKIRLRLIRARTNLYMIRGFDQFDLRQFRRNRGSQPIVDFDAADNCRLDATTRKGLKFQVDTPWIAIDNIKGHYVVASILTSRQDDTENCRYPELVGGPLKLELNFAFPLEHVTELIVLRDRISSVAVDNFGVIG